MASLNSDPKAEPEKEVPKVELTPGAIAIITIAGIIAISLSVVITVFPAIVTYLVFKIFPEWSP